MTQLVLQEPIVTSIAIDHQMAVIHVQVRKNIIEVVLLDGGYGIILLWRS
jgi:hypothetical protein